MLKQPYSNGKNTLVKRFNFVFITVTKLLLAFAVLTLGILYAALIELWFLGAMVGFICAYGIAVLIWSRADRKEEARRELEQKRQYIRLHRVAGPTRDV